MTNLSQDFMERWYGELKIIKRLHHANVVQALDVPAGLQYQPMGNVPFICMEYCDKGDLRQVGVVMGVACGVYGQEHGLWYAWGPVCVGGVAFMHRVAMTREPLGVGWVWPFFPAVTWHNYGNKERARVGGCG